MSGSVAATRLRSGSRLRSLFGTTNLCFSVSNSALRQAPTPSSFRLRRRAAVFLNSLIPIHTIIASASLVSKLPSQVSASTQGLLIMSIPSSGKLVQGFYMLIAQNVKRKLKDTKNGEPF